MKIALLSDSHNNWNALKTVVDSSVASDCEVALFAGDLTRPKGIDMLANLTIPVHQVIGNMDSQIDTIWSRASETNNVIFHGEECDIERAGVRIYMQHHPEPVAAEAQKDIYDLCVHGHLHEFRHETTDSGTQLINPGALTRRSSQPEWAAVDTKTREVIRHKI